MLRNTFNEDARLYQSSRPRYPEALFDALADFTHLLPTSRLLEIGPGTGQATEPLAKRGFHITAVELGADLAEEARQVLNPYKNVQIITGAFEDVELPSNSYDLIYAATAFHWIKPEYRYVKTNRLLKKNGFLAIIHTEHVSDEVGDAFFKATQPVYDKHTPKNTEGEYQMPQMSKLKPPQIDETRFKLLFFKPFPLVISYSSEQYTNLLRTYSSTLSLPMEKHGLFLQGIADVIDNQFNGCIKRHFAMTLAIAQKLFRFD